MSEENQLIPQRDHGGFMNKVTGGLRLQTQQLEERNMVCAKPWRERRKCCVQGKARVESVINIKGTGGRYGEVA